ncbi:MAG: hydroxyacid dehydrogenase [Oscillospiraceae bacterium]|jgi:uncharacterized protein YgbK (DUF1537 family)|nr:hydroxyacid dehydrogenase [Oscillospiraceae bacterium]
MIKALDASVLETFPAVDRTRVEKDLTAELAALNRKIVVLDDDPTGVQTVQGVNVYTSWDREAIRAGFDEENSMFFILTNSRGFTAAQTKAVHTDIAHTLLRVAEETGKEFILISRSDSTLRGHYPLETQTLRDVIEANSTLRYDGEVIVPFFKEGGRFTIGNVHYVREGDSLTPAGMTEFAKDKTFAYTSSHLGDWCAEKTGGAHSADAVTYVSLESLRALDYDGIQRQLMTVRDFDKVIVNAVDYIDVRIFAVALIRALRAGKAFMFRSAAALTKVLGGIPDRAPLARQDIISGQTDCGGVVLVGSHVNKTTRQLEELKNCAYPIDFLEFNQHLVLEEGGLEREVERVVGAAQEAVRMGKTVAVYTRRERFDLDTADGDRQLEVSVKISDAVTSIIGKMTVRPSFIIAKGGITSSDVGVKALKVKKALVMGQISPGIPVWMTGCESKFPDMPYIIFPGNVGEEDTLRRIVETLMARD